MGTTITAEIRGSEEGGRLGLSALIDQLNALRDVLRQTERLLYGQAGSVYYRIDELRQNSPATITVEAIPTSGREDNSTRIVDRFFTYLDRLSLPLAPPPEMDLAALEAFKRLAPTKHRHVLGLSLRNGSAAKQLDEGFAEQVSRAIGPDHIVTGSVVGALEMINLHNTPRFAVFTAIGERKVTCDFSSDLREQVIASIDKWVRVSGKLRRKKWDRHPHAVDVERIDVFPSESSLSQIDALAGLNPDIVGDQSPEDFVRALRSGAI